MLARAMGDAVPGSVEQLRAARLPGVNRNTLASAAASCRCRPRASGGGGACRRRRRPTDARGCRGVTIAAVRCVTGLALIAVATFAGCGPIVARGGDVPYVQTPDRVVHEMLSLAGVGADDVVYDLGAGDGRIVIAAARWYGAQGVGIEIDPALVRQARSDAARAGVADRVRFESGDLFAADLREATVVTLYLSPELNERLRPRLSSQLRPGARIVSHQFAIGDWVPDRTMRLTVDGREHLIRLWIIRPPRR